MLVKDVYRLDYDGPTNHMEGLLTVKRAEESLENKLYKNCSKTINFKTSGG